MSWFKRRTKYFVDRSLQLRFSRFTILLTLFTSVATAVAIFFTTLILLGSKLAEVYPQGRLEAIFRSVYATFFVTMIVILPVIFYASIVFSHRIAGPLPKIYQVLRSIGEGNFDVRLTLRKKDLLRSLADAINDMSRNLKERENKKTQ